MSVDVAKDSLARVMAIVCETGPIESISADEDFYDAGFTSLKSLQLLLQLETEWGLSIPDDEFIVARSARSLDELLTRLKHGAPCV